MGDNAGAYQVDGMLTELRTDLCKLGIVMSSTMQSQPLSRFVFPREKKKSETV